jgi:hypothetical protein
MWGFWLALQQLILLLLEKEKHDAVGHQIYFIEYCFSKCPKHILFLNTESLSRRSLADKWTSKFDCWQFCPSLLCEDSDNLTRAKQAALPANPLPNKPAPAACIAFVRPC